MLDKINGQVVLCSNPVRFDDYRGCSHGCLYCFATKANKKFKTKEEFFSSIIPEKLNDLKNFLKNPINENYVQNTPIHWGGMSDGFQPIEVEKRISYEALKLFAKYKYPVIIFTKGVSVITRDEYLELLKKCNVVIQISIMSKSVEKWEKYTKDYESRIKAIKKLLDNGIKVIVRIQPYMTKYKKEVLEMLDDLKGIEGVTIEGYKDTAKFENGLIRVGREYMYPIETLFNDFIEIRDKAKQNGLRFFVAENRLRWLGDDANCCGVGHIKGFENKNKLNVTELFFYKYITFSNMPKIKGNVLTKRITQNTY